MIKFKKKDKIKKNNRKELLILTNLPLQHTRRYKACLGGMKLQPIEREKKKHVKTRQ